MTDVSALKQTDCGCHTSVNQQAGAVDVAGGRTAQVGYGIGNLLTLSRTRDGDNSRNHALNLGVLLQLLV